MAKTLVLREKVYIPISDLSDHEDRLDDLYTIDVFDEPACEKCEERDNRPCDPCLDCPAYLARKKLWNHKVVKGQDFVGLPYGKRRLMLEVFPKLKTYDILDKRPDIPFKTKLRFTGQLRSHQQEANDELEAQAAAGKLCGILLAPARSGKTVVSIELACRLKVRTLILANTHPLCQQFYNTCVGSAEQEPLTNAPQLVSAGKTPVVLASKPADFLKGDIVITTYQKFITDLGAERLKEIASNFSLIIIDEVHRAPAQSYLKVIASLNALFKLGLTATKGRKDGMEVLNDYVLGPTLHRIEVETLVPRVIFHETGLFPAKDYSNWVYFCRWLERQADRTRQILDHVFIDLKKGRSIVIPCTFTSQIHELVRRINWEYGRNIAAAVVGGTSKRDLARREEILDKARQGKYRVIVGTRSIIGTGVNVPAWDTLYWVVPMSNPPNWVQEYSRILTPVEGKKPIIRMFLDGSSQTRGCLRTCLFKTEGETPTLASTALIDPDQWAIANRYLRKGKMDPTEYRNPVKADPVVTKQGRKRAVLG